MPYAKIVSNLPSSIRHLDKMFSLLSVSVHSNFPGDSQVLSEKTTHPQPQRRGLGGQISAIRMYIATRAESSPGRGRNISWNRLNEKNSKESAVRQTRKNGSKDEQTILSRFLYGSLPVVYQDVKHYTAYWFECALRSSAVLGFIGLPTQGFFIDSAFADHKLDKAIILILIAAVLNMGIDTISQVLRRRLKISTKLVTSF